MPEALTEEGIRPSRGTPEDCPDCEGRGWVLSADGGAGSARPCDCRKRRRSERLIAAAGVPSRYLGCTLAGFKTSHPDRGTAGQLQRARRAAERYLEEYLQEDGGFRESGLLFIGPPGVGKTHLAVAVLVAVIRQYGRQGRFVDFTGLVHQIQSTFDPRSPESKREILDPVIEADILVLDELGAQKPTAWVQDLLYYVINSRYTERRPTLFTTNYRLDGPERTAERSLDRGPDEPNDRFSLLSERIQPQLISRLYEMTHPVVIDAAGDYRRAVKMHQHRL